MEKREIIKEFLKLIKIDIEMIDGGCQHCIKDFADGVNEVLINYDLEIIVLEDYPITVEIKNK